MEKHTIKKKTDKSLGNKVLREKSNCVVCQSSKSRFLNEKQNDKK